VKKVLFVVLIVMLLLAMALPAFAKPAPKINICHSSGNGKYHLINVSESAKNAHLAHGDGAIGDAVPDTEGYVFGDSCNPELISVAQAGCFLWHSGHYVLLDGSVIQYTEDQPAYNDEGCSTFSFNWGNGSEWAIWASTAAEAAEICRGTARFITDTPNLWRGVGCNPLP